MNRRTKRNDTHLLWPMALGIGLAVLLLLALAPAQPAQAQGGPPDVGIRKFNMTFGDPGHARPGGVYVYNVVYGNSDSPTVVATDTIIVDTLPMYTTYAGDTSDLTHTIGGDVITWYVGDLDPANSGSFMVTLNVSSTAPTGTGVITSNCVFITSTVAHGDYNPDNNTHCSNPVDVWEGQTDISVNKWLNHPFDPTPGQEMQYNVNWCTQPGPHVGPVWLTDTLPISTTVVDWRWDGPRFWTEVITTGVQFVLHAPGLPGGMCQELYLTLRLDPDAPLGANLENTVVITAPNDPDGDLGNNWTSDNNGQVSQPRYDVRLDKSIHGELPVTGGWVNYFIDCANDGNIDTPVWVTETVPDGLSFAWASWGGGDQPNADQPITPTVVGDDLVFELGVIPIGASRWFHVQMDISDTVTAGDVITNYATAGITATEATPGNNTDSAVVTINPAGPNLRVTKWHNWNGDGQLGYQIFFENIGDQTIDDVWITDTLPISTSWNNWSDWNGFNFDEGRLISDPQDNGDLRWNFSYLEPGDSGWLYFDAKLDTPGQRMRWYTNTVEITTPPTDTTPADNVYTDVAFSGGEVDWIDLNVHGSDLQGCAPNAPITITTPYTERVLGDSCWNEWFDQPFRPGDIVTVAAGAGLHPVVIHIPDPFTAIANSATGMVWGQVDALDHETIQVHPNHLPFPQNVQTDDSGHYSATFPFIPRGVSGEVRYNTTINYANVTFHRPIQSLDLALNVQYGHDWIEGNYEPGHTVWITVTNPAGDIVKGAAELQTGPIPWWGGQSGFSTNWEGWDLQPDIQPDDWVYGRVDNGQTTQLQIGTITGTVDVDADSIMGRIYAPWFTETLYVNCQDWAGVGAPGKDSSAGPDGDPPYFCQWDPGSEWDVQPGQDIGVWYVGPDQNQVGDIFREPMPSIGVSKWTNDNPAEGGNLGFQINYWNNGDYAENVIISDTLLSGMTYLTDTSGLPHTGSGAPGDPLVWELGVVPGNVNRGFNLFVQVTAAVSEVVTNTVEITTSSPYNQSPPEDLHSTWSGTVQGNDTRLNVDKRIDGDNPAPDTDFTWTINVCNNGSTGSSELTLTDTLPISTTLLNWWGQNAGWTEVSSTDDHLVLSYPSIPGWWCGEVYLRFHLDENAWIGMPISNTVEISAANDLNGGSSFTDWREVNGRYTNLYVESDWRQGQLTPGGDLWYNVGYGNNGNAPADTARLTYTLPASTTFSGSSYHDWQGHQYPFPPTTVADDVVVWDVGPIANGFNRNLSVQLHVDEDAAPGTALTSTLEITPHPSDYHHDDNAVTWAEMLNGPGPNLEVHKQNYQWNGSGQLNYEIRIKNRGTERLEPVWVTDTYPISTTWNGNWQVGHGPWITLSHDAPNLILWLQSLEPGETASVDIQVDLDWAIHGVQGLYFTNTLSAPVPDDVYPADNEDEVVAYAGPDIYATAWLREGTPRPGEIVTFTVGFGNDNRWPDMDGGWDSRVTVTLPSAMTFITATAPWDPNQRWTPDAILPGSTHLGWDWGTPWPDSDWYFQVAAQITDTAQSGDVIQPSITYQDENPDNVDRSPDNDTYELPLVVLNPVFEVSKVYQSSEVAGMPITYTLTVTNTGNDPGTNVVLSDTVPAYLEDVGSGGTLQFPWLWWHFDVITPGGMVNGSFNATLPCTRELSIVNDDYGVRWSDQGVTGVGDPVSFTVRAPTIQAALTHTLGSIVVSDTVRFTGTAATDGTGLSYTWDLGGGTGPMSGGVTTTHIYTQDGDYTVVFTATDRCGYSQATTATVTVAAPDLMADFDYSPKPANVLVGSTVAFTDTSTTDVPPIVGWQWDFGDGSDLAFTQNATHTYETDDVYTVTLVVTDGLGYSDAEVKTAVVTVTAPHLMADFDYSPKPANVLVGSTVAFTDTSTTDVPPIVGWQWDFGDGSDLAFTQNATHTYETDDVYTVTLVVTDGLGYSDAEVKTAVVTVTESCIGLTGVTFEYAPPNPVIGTAVIFTATVAPGDATTPITYVWDFGDNVTHTVNTASTSHTYAVSGTLNVIVTAYNPCTSAGVSTTPRGIDIAPRRVFLPLVLRND